MLSALEQFRYNLLSKVIANTVKFWPEAGIILPKWKSFVEYTFEKKLFPNLTEDAIGKEMSDLWIKHGYSPDVLNDWLYLHKKMEELDLFQGVMEIYTVAINQVIAWSKAGLGEAQKTAQYVFSEIGNGLNKALAGILGFDIKDIIILAIIILVIFIYFRYRKG